MMARGEDIVLDDTSCFRWLRKSYSQLARQNGYSSELVYLDVSLSEVAGRIARNSITAARPAIESKVFDTHFQDFESPQADEFPTVLNGEEEIYDGWIRNVAHHDWRSR
jgi:predicted kinase